MSEVYAGFVVESGVCSVPDHPTGARGAFIGFPVRSREELKRYHRGDFQYRVMSKKGTLITGVKTCTRGNNKTFNKLLERIEQECVILVHPKGLDDGET